MTQLNKPHINNYRPLRPRNTIGEIPPQPEEEKISYKRLFIEAVVTVVITIALQETYIKLFKK